MPINPIVGREGLAATLQAFLAPALEVSWPVAREVEQGSTVINERVDRFRLAGGWVELPVVGIFEVGDDGLITLWRDYFDMGAYQRQVAAVSAPAS
jgi:limonene-1,2-epoxide hydrolase